MDLRIGINGFGRIGRGFFRCAVERGWQVVAVNDVAGPAALTHLLRYDSTYGRFPVPVELDGDTIRAGDAAVPVLAARAPKKCDWGSVGADIVVEATGRFRDRETAAGHLTSGPRKVIISAPGKSVDATLVMGVNEDTYEPDRHHVVSAASCTTNCVAPMVKVLHDAFGIDRGYLTTVHAYTADQMLIDGPHKDLRRARSAATNIIPTSTGAARSVGLVIPDLAGRLDGVAVRVPVVDGSLTDLTCVLRREVTAEEVNEAFAAAAAGGLAGILRYSTDPIVSHDIIGDPASCVFDAPLTQAAGTVAKTFGWYDNEWGYINRLADVVQYVAGRG